MRVLGSALLQHLVCGDRRSHSGYQLAALAHFLKCRLHAPLQMESAVKNDIRLQQPRHIVTRRFVEVGIHTIGNQSRYFRPSPRHLAHEVRHHARRANNFHLGPDRADHRHQKSHSRTQKKFHTAKIGAPTPAWQGNAQHRTRNPPEPKIWTIVQIFGSPSRMAFSVFSGWRVRDRVAAC